MNLNIQIKFASIYSKCLSEQQTVQDIGDLVLIIRNNRTSISDNAKKILLQIPLCVLETQVNLKEDNSIWASKNGKFFAGNYTKEPIHSKFSSENFDLSIMVDCLNEIMSAPQLLNSDYNLRNPEATLRDHVTPNPYSNFYESGKLFARIMEKAFDC